MRDATIPPAIRRAQEYLLSRRCLDGGWNHGGSLQRSETSTSYAETTGLALLALHSCSSPSLEVTLRFAETLLQKPDSTEGVCWLLIGLAAHGRTAAAAALEFDAEDNARHRALASHVAAPLPTAIHSCRPRYELPDTQPPAFLSSAALAAAATACSPRRLISSEPQRVSIIRASSYNVDLVENHPARALRSRRQASRQSEFCSNRISSNLVLRLPSIPTRSSSRRPLRRSNLSARRASTSPKDQAIAE